MIKQKQIDEDCKDGGGFAKGGHDDIVAVGPPEVVIRAFLRMEGNMREQCGTKFQRTKSVLYRGSACSLPENLPAGLRFGEEEVDGKMVRGFLLYGAPIGEPDYISLKLRQRAE